MDSRVPGVDFVRGCLEWLLGNHCSTVVVENTGTYWVPVWNVLHERVAVIVANLEHGKARRGEKTDPEGSRRLAERLRVGMCGVVSFPSAQIVELRDRTRRRKRLWSAANSERNRIQKLLEPANVKIGNVVSDVFGISGQRILHSLFTLETRWLAFSSETTSVTPLPRLLLRSFAVLSKMRAWEIESPL